ncbi:MAG TPA: hypothetical protein VFE20_07780 [Thermoleophilia bacterium]|nr:hypothetical protein [Thermoleophilia bacterium]
MEQMVSPRRYARGAVVEIALLLPVLLACLLLVAHYLRSFQPQLMMPFLLLPLLLLVRRRWAARVVQVALLFGAFEWVTTALLLLGERRGLGEPYGRMLAILFGVAGFTLLTGALLEAPRLRRRYAKR